jgi:hypothetical protein
MKSAASLKPQDNNDIKVSKVQPNAVNNLQVSRVKKLFVNINEKTNLAASRVDGLANRVEAEQPKPLDKMKNLALSQVSHFSKAKKAQGPLPTN